MPQVKEYLPEQEAAGPVGQTSPLLEQATMFGRGIESFGREVGDAMNVVRQRETMRETSDAYANVAEQRANYLTQIEDARNKGTLDDKAIDGLKQNYQDWVDKQYDSYSTAGGKDAFVRASARAGGAILLNAAHGAAAVAGAKAKDNLANLSTTNSNIVLSDPRQFDDVRHSQQEAIQAQVDAGALSPMEAERTKQGMDIELAKAATRGFMQSDYASIKQSVIDSGGKIDPNSPRLNSALGWLNHGEVNDILNSDNKKALETEIRANQQAAQTAGMQAISVKTAALDAKGEAWKFDSYQKLETNDLKPDEVTQAYRGGLISLPEHQAMLHLINQASKEQLESNPAIVNQMRMRILSPDNAPDHISDPMQLAPMVQAKMISMSDFNNLAKTMRMTPQYQLNNFNESNLMDKAKAAIGTDHPDSEYRLKQFSQEVQNAKQQALKDGTPLNEIWDPKSPKWAGNLIQKYLTTPQQALAAQAARIRGEAVQPMEIQTQPGVIPKPSGGKP